MVGRWRTLCSRRARGWRRGRARAARGARVARLRRGMVSNGEGPTIFLTIVELGLVVLTFRNILHTYPLYIAATQRNRKTQRPAPRGQSLNFSPRCRVAPFTLINAAIRPNKVNKFMYSGHGLNLIAELSPPSLGKRKSRTYRDALFRLTCTCYA